MIPVYEPSLDEEELENILEAVKSGWISSKGKFIPEFEESFAKYCSVKYGVACSNGTAALHLALTALGLKKGDEVIVPDLTFVSTANTVVFTGAKPIFADSNPEYWCIDPEKIKETISKHTKAIIPVHLYGHPCDMAAIMTIAHDNDLFVVEDAAEAHGAEYNGKKVGSFGDVNCFSFYGNKTITTGEGGICVTNNEELAETIRVLRDHGMNPTKKYWYDRIGFNYRMTNIQAAIGVAQLKKLNTFIQKKRKIAEWYAEEFEDLEHGGFVRRHPEMPWAKNIYWMYSILIEDNFPVARNKVIEDLEKRGIETRPFFCPIHALPMYNRREKNLISEELARKGMNLPSSANLGKEEVTYIAETILRLLTLSKSQMNYRKQ